MSLVDHEAIIIQLTENIVSISNQFNEQTESNLKFAEYLLAKLQIVDQIKYPKSSGNKKLSELNNKNDKNIEVHKEVENELKTLQEQKEELYKEVLKLQAEHKNLKLKLKKVSHKKQKLDETRDEIRLYKLLTGTSFNYFDAIEVSGYIKKPNGQLSLFSFDPNNTSQEEITNELWKMVENN